MSARVRVRKSRLLLTVAGISAMTVLAACAANPNAGSSPTTGGGTTPAAETTAAETSGGIASATFVNPLPDYPAWRTIGDCMADEAEARGIDFTESGPTGGALDATKMIEQIQQAVANKVGGIITFPTSDAFTPVLQQARDAGIVTGTLYGDGGDVAVGPNYADLGAMFVEAIAKREGPQVAGLVAQTDTGSSKEWMDGVKAAAAKTDNVTVVGEVYTNDDAAKALDQTNALLTAHPEVNVILTHMGSATPGIAAAIKQSAAGRVVFVSGGADNGGKEAVLDGTAYGAWLQGLCEEGKQVLGAVADIAEGKDVEQHLGAKETIATKDDIETLLGQGWG
jgi:ABC-type sugar transport system substrate-binding protein